MQQASDPRIKIFIIAAVLLVVGGIAFTIMGDNRNSNSSGGTPKLILSETNFDFGDISMARGLTKHTFMIKNEGDGDLKISKIITSCMCTTAVLDVNGKKSPKFGMPGHGANPFGWSQVLKPGETANLEATFDPLAHGSSATGPITREITITSNNGGKEGMVDTIIFRGDVIK